MTDAPDRPQLPELAELPEEPEHPHRGGHRRLHRRAGRVATYAVLSLLAAVTSGFYLFLASEHETTLASHDVVMRPQLDGYAEMHTGPVLPDVRVPTGSRLGVDIELGKTDATTTAQLLERYAYIASQPDGEVRKVSEELSWLGREAALRGALVGLVPVALLLLLGERRRRELWAAAPSWRGAAALGSVAVLVVGLWQPWDDEPASLGDGRAWVALDDWLGPEVPLPDELRDLEVRGDVTTQQTRRLVASAVDTYDRSKRFYVDAAEAALELNLRQPEEGESVVLLVSDRHDNIGMDPVARAVADAGGASGVFDAGDDTSSGSAWESFSLDSVTAVFADVEDRWAVTGNHDHGNIVGPYLADGGWEVLQGEVVDGPGGTRLLGVGDPRASGLGTWRDEGGLSFSEVEDRLAEAACAADEAGERVATVLVHDPNLGREALSRGCVDLVVGGHLHVDKGPDAVLGANGETGYSFTTGTTGGAAYAIAIGSKLRRDAMVSLVTYRDGRPAGVQTVTLRTDGRYRVGAYAPLTYP